MFGTAIRYFAKKAKPKMRPVSLKTPLEQRQTITRALFDIVNEHGPLTIGETWQRVQDVGLQDLQSKTHMKLVLRWMKEKQKLRLICNHVGAHKQFLYTTWFSKDNVNLATAKKSSSKA
ncbi:hypothetical protein QN277_009965 [Acacia crassicarpa]|uniref:Uncharacterized protein n=1 Tax=Acacia crassicarpa TaxID=499986 RepID=A0AAE1IRY5_9FABA|nr:hypothetical protein QN277_009965 [Acacia crassicarpa]